MKLIVGLGNPGKKYEKTRHNIGFMVVDALANKYDIQINKDKFNGKYGEGIINNEKVILLKPFNYINLSGEVIRKIVDYYKIDLNDMLIIVDDMSLNFNDFKLKARGSSGGHNGLYNIEQNLKSQEYYRLKIGIGSNDLQEKRNYVLGKLSIKEEAKLNEKIELYIDIITDFANIDFLKLMNKYNGTR